MEKTILRYALDNLIQGTNLVNQHSDFTEYTREDIVSVINYLLNDGHTLENNFKKRLVHIIEIIYNQEFKVENMPEVYKIFNITVERTNTGKYYASINIETEIQPLPKTGKQVGFDLGLIDLLIGSDGTRVERPKFAYAFKDKLAKEQRKLSKMRTKLERVNANLDECKNYQKQKRKVAKLHEHIANSAKDFNHKLSRKLVEEYDFIAMEDLNIEGMKKNHKLAYSISDVRWSQLLNFIRYKCSWYEKEFKQVDRLYASSKICSCCGTYHKDIVNSLSVREWICPDCGTHHDRDVNAARNILIKALSVA